MKNSQSKPDGKFKRKNVDRQTKNKKRKTELKTKTENHHVILNDNKTDIRTLPHAQYFFLFILTYKISYCILKLFLYILSKTCIINILQYKNSK